MTTDTTKRILVAEDNPALATVVQFNLQRAGYEVSVAANGKIAAQRLDEDRFDLLITDHQMPEMTGIELCTELRQKADYATLPIVMLTAKGLELELNQLKEELKIDATFPKPFSPVAVVTRVQELLAQTE